jgi:hypothetical protein
MNVVTHPEQVAKSGTGKVERRGRFLSTDTTPEIILPVIDSEASSLLNVVV